jgi:hypothetical protein
MRLCHTQRAGAGETVARKKKSKRFSATKAVKAAAREHIGTPPPTRRTPTLLEKTRKPEKHKPTLGTLLGEGE